jgi:endoglucanase
MFAQKFRDNPRVIGMDMRNEIRKANGLEPTWGDGNPLTDWRRAASISAEIALKNAPHWLIFIGGLNYQLDLSGVKENPIYLSVPNKLVYTGHFYGFSWLIPSWNVYPYEKFHKKLLNTQTYVRGLDTPFLLGEFGNNTRDIPWNYLMRYLKETDIDWTYWALDGFKNERCRD